MDGCQKQRIRQMVDVQNHTKFEQTNNTNNNTLEDGNNNSMSAYSSDKVLIFQDLRSNRSSNDSNEDWQILEADDPQLQCGEINDNKSLNNNKLDKCTMGHLRELGATKSEKYIEISPPNTTQIGHDPLLVYLCTAIYSLMPLASLLATFTIIGLFFTKLYFISLLYIVYILWDRNTCNKGGRRVDFIYRSRFWSYLASYFPIKLRHSTNFELDPNENYILNYSPHGISAFGAVTAFATDGLNFSKLFPGITPRFMVHETSFVVPVMREVFALRGDCSVNSKSIDYMLSSKTRDGKAGNLLTIVVGGLAEADLSDSEILKIVVAERKGFVKKALIHGANIIPCIAFGENSVFTKVNLKQGSLMQRLESKWYDLFKFKHPIYYGRSLISDALSGVMPYKRSITVVLGDPIVVRRIEKPTQEDIDSIHKIYISRLRAMYKANDDLRVKYDTTLELL